MRLRKFSVQASADFSILPAPAERLHDGDDEYDDEEEDDDDDDRNLICLDINNDRDYKQWQKLEFYSRMKKARNCCCLFLT